MRTLTQFLGEEGATSVGWAASQPLNPHCRRIAKTFERTWLVDTLTHTHTHHGCMRGWCVCVLERVPIPLFTTPPRFINRIEKSLCASARRDDGECFDNNDTHTP